MKHPICKTSDLPSGERTIVELEGKSIGIFNVNGAYYALRNVCPHQKAPLCKGNVGGTTLPSKPGEYIWGCEGQIVRCPWHGWEFNITTGESVFNPHRIRVKSYQVTVEPGAEDEVDPAVETYDVSVEDQQVFLHL
jgi:nitrite reductase (NADH) small subunit